MNSTAGRIAAGGLIWIGVTAAPMAQTSRVSVVHEYVPAGAIAPGPATVPSNFKVSSVYHDLVNEMLGRSPTFRRQIMRIAGAQHLTIYLQAGHPPWPRNVRATTRFERDPMGKLSAWIEIMPLNAQVELIAHEIEHVIEQLDDVDLERKADRSNSGVRSNMMGGAGFETTRATRTGLQVAQEVR